MTRGPETFFTPHQKAAHDAQVGHQCEWYSRHGERCPETQHLEADHVIPVREGGQTVDENFMWACIGFEYGISHHALKHGLDEEFDAEKTILGRLRSLLARHP